MKALLDGDLVAFRSAASCKEDDDKGIAIWRANKLVEQLLIETNASSHTIYLSGGDNFRKEIDPLYKANRINQPRPQWLEAVREFLVLEWNAIVTDGIEADDVMGIAQCTENNFFINHPDFYGESQTMRSCIVSLDKDMQMIPGWHYSWAIAGPNWTKEAKWNVVHELDGLRNFYISSLIGDVADNISGVKGLGKAKAPRELEGCITEEDMFKRCRTLYDEDDRFFRNLQLLWIQRKENDVFSRQRFLELCNS